MNFYTAISEHYDAIFPVDTAEMAFVADLLTGRRKVLDIGCGTGNKTVLLQQNDRTIMAVDADETMIDRARRDNAGTGITYGVMDMREIGAACPPKAFDAVLCLGNTLVHLPGPEAIAGMLHDTAALLDTGGLGVVQILNYDRILDTNMRNLPTLETGELRFSRRYEWQNEEMLFVTELLLKGSGETIRNAIPLYPLRKAELDAALARAGFGQVAYYGSYAGTPLAADSFVLIAVARK